MGYVFSPKTTISLMQNCDLPLPTKLFTGGDGVFVPSISKIYGLELDNRVKIYRDDKLEILKALHLSQTRATEAEKKLRILAEEKETVSRLLLNESMILLAHRQWVNLLEFHVMKLEREGQEEGRERASDQGEEWSMREDCSSKKWYAAVAVCFAIAGVGFALGCRYLL